MTCVHSPTPVKPNLRLTVSGAPSLILGTCVVQQGSSTWKIRLASDHIDLRNSVPYLLRSILRFSRKTGYSKRYNSFVTHSIPSIPISTSTMGWRDSRWFSWCRRTPRAPAVDDEKKGHESQGEVINEKPRGKGEQRQDTLHTVKLPSAINEAPLEYAPPPPT